jgi:predicted DNA-binding transcriptional regulator AlpA
MPVSTLTKSTAKGSPQASRTGTVDSLRRSLQTNEAARYLGVSRSLLRKMRMRAPGDPGGQGPAFIKLSPQLVVYDIAALDAWLDEHANLSRRAA